MIIYTLKYNNYFNREVKGFDTLDGYSDYVVHMIEKIEFNPNDGVSTKIILNTDDPKVDYLLVVDENGEINSRWFILDSQRIRFGQFEFSLFRDVLYDYYYQTITAPCFIEKATLPPENPLIYNNEGMTFNKIKKSENSLVDLIGCSWIVGYVKKDTPQTIINIDLPTSGKVDFTVSTLEEYENYRFVNNIAYTNLKNIRLGIKNWYAYSTHGNVIGFDTAGNLANPPIGKYDIFGRTTVSEREGYGRKADLNIFTPDPLEALMSQVPASAKQSKNLLENTDYKSYFTAAFGEGEYIDDISTLHDDNAKLIFDQSTGKYYRIKVKQLGVKRVINKEVSMTSSLGSTMSIITTRCNGFDGDIKGTTPFSVGAEVTAYKIELVEVAGDASQIIFPGPGERISNYKLPYDIFCIPVGGMGFRITFLPNTITYITEEMSFTLAASISTALSSNLIDLQLLPYCPVDQKYYTRIGDGAGFAMELMPENEYAVLRGQGDNSNKAYGMVFFVNRDSFTQTLYKPAEWWGQDFFRVEKPTDAVDIKIMNETKLYRIVSPNYNGAFEINPAKNGGIKNLKADCTYKPFTPYIRVYPEFNELYGSNFGDDRGLICGGDFSLPRTESDWINYQISNKNYQVMFNRQITNMELNNSFAMREAKINAVVGSIGAGAQAGITAGSVGGPWAGLAAGAAGGILSGIAGAQDVKLLRERQAEAKNFAIDQYGYELGNIQARPQNITQLSAFDINSKPFPFVEEYGATEVEESALRDKLKYNGMTVMTIGTIQQFMHEEPSFIKGKLIKIPELQDDYHLALTISEEIDKGVYI